MSFNTSLDKNTLPIVYSEENRMSQKFQSEINHKNKK